MFFERIARCPVCKQQIDVLTTPKREPDGMAEAMILGPSRSMHALKSPSCVGAPGWSRGWDLDEPVEVPTPPFTPTTGVAQQ